VHSNWARRAAPLLVLLSLYPLWTAAFGLFGPDEPRYASIARAMAETGDWITPRLDGEPWLEKPPLLYWLSAAGFRFGLGPESAPRVPLALLSAAFLLWFALFTRRWLGQSRALFAAMLLAASAGWLAYSHVAVTDVPLSVSFTAAMLLSLAWVESRRARYAVAAGVCFGLAMLAKGLVPVVLAAPLIWFARHRWRQWPFVIVGALAVALPWYSAVTQREGWAFIDEFFLEHHFGRFATDELQHVQPFWFYVPAIVGLFLPGTLFLFRAPWRDPRFRFFAVWFAFGFVFFSAATNKLPGYILPLLPPLAILAAAGMPESSRIPARLTVAMALVILTAKLGALPYLDGKLTPRSLAASVPADACADAVSRGFRYGLHYYLRRPLGDCWQMPGATPILPSGPDASPALRYTVTHAAPGPLSGRLLVFATQYPVDGPVVLPSDAEPNRVWLAAREVLHWPPGVPAAVDPTGSAFPGPITSAPAGRYHFSAVFDPDYDFPYRGLTYTDLHSSLITVENFNPHTPRTMAFHLSHSGSVPPLRRPSHEVPSKLLSRFHRRPVALQADVVPGPLPGRILVIHAFGETFADSRLRRQLLAIDRRPTLVFLNSVHRFGHHAFTDSAVNGPWARALLEELLPALPPGPAPTLLGEGAGGWAAAYLKQAHPDKFGPAYALQPDPLDFRNFFGVSLTDSPKNLYTDPAGGRRPFLGDWFIETSALREAVLGPHAGRWESWESVFGPRTSEGISRQLFGRDNGDIDPTVLRHWLRFNLAARPIEARIISDSELPAILQSK
jgi:4-amino-4-deoxy-L-arabinose transferase-like glycosyltransferase